MTIRATLFLSTALVACLLPAKGPAQTPDVNATHLDHKGQHKFLLHPETMIVEATDRIKTNPKDFSAYLHRGLGYWAAHNFDKATADIHKSIELNPTKTRKKQVTPQDKVQLHSLARAYYELGCIYCTQHQYKIGIENLSQAIEIAPDMAEAYKNRALAFKTIGQAVLAQKDYEKAAELLATHQSDQASNMIEVELDKLVEPDSVGDEEDSARQLVATTAQIKKETDVIRLARLYRLRAQLNNKLGRFKESLADQDWAHNNDPMSFRSASRRDQVESLLKQYGSSTRDFDRKLFSNSGANDLIQANNLVGAKKLDQAQTLLLNHTKTFPNDAMAYSMLYAIHLSTGKPQLALVDLSRIIAIDPTNRAVYIWRADAYEKLRKFKQAAADYSFVLGFDPTSQNTRPAGVPLDQAYFRRADAFRQLKQLDEAIADYTSILRLEPSEEEAFRSRGDCYFAKGTFDKAIADYTKSISLDPDSAGSTYLARAKVYEAMKKTALAAQDRATALQLSSQGKPLTRTRETSSP